MVNTAVGMAGAIVAYAIGGTLRAIRWNLAGESLSRRVRWYIGLVRLPEVFCYLLACLSLCYAFPHPLTIVGIVLLIASLMANRILRANEERKVLNAWLSVADTAQAPLPMFIERIGSGFRSSLSWRTRDCARRISEGADFREAVRRSRLPVDAVLLNRLGAANRSTEKETAQSGWSLSNASNDTTTLVRTEQQLAYALITPIVGLTLGGFMTVYILPTIRELSEEFGTTPTPSGRSAVELAEVALQTISYWSLWVLAVLIIWLVMAAFRRRLFAFTVRWIPWFGRSGIDLWRVDCLRQLGEGVRCREPAEELIGQIRMTSRSRWLRSKCKRALQYLSSGMSLPMALQRAAIISKREQAWLASAQANHHLSDAIVCLSEDVARDREHRWYLRVTWLVPLVTTVVSLYVLLFAGYMIAVLSQLIEQSS
ncbi:MAG: type II secretion system F family protein [Planctomycetota bacterium]